MDKRLSYSELLLALALWREARGSTLKARRCIGSVIYNRLKDPRWPNTLEEVILQPLQFSAFNPGDVNAVKFPTPAARADWLVWESCMEMASREPTMASREPWSDETGGSNHYHSCGPKNLPPWHDEAKVKLRVGPFTFLKL